RRREGSGALHVEQGGDGGPVPGELRRPGRVHPEAVQEGRLPRQDRAAGAGRRAAGPSDLPPQKLGRFMADSGMENIKVGSSELSPGVWELRIDGSLDWSNFAKVETAIEDI